MPTDGSTSGVASAATWDKTAFYIRLNNGTVELDDQEKQKYMATRWP